MTPEIQKVPDLTKPLPLSLTNSTSSIPESPHLLPKRESSTPQLLPQKLQTKTLSKNDKSLDLTLLKPSHLLQNKRPKAIANPPEPTKSSDIFESKPVKQIGKIEILPSSERLQQEINIKRVPHVDVVEEPISVKREKFKPKKNSDKPDLPSQTNSIMLTSSSPKPIWYNEPFDLSKNVTDQSKTSKKRRFEMSAEKYQIEENSKEPKNLNSSINSQSTTVKPILLNSYLIKSNLPNEPVDSSKNVVDQSNTSKKPRPKMTANTTEPTMNPAMSKNKPETSSEKSQTEENSKEKQIVNSSINSQSTSVKPILLNSYLIKSNLPNEPVDSSKNVADQSNTSKKPRPEMITNTREPSMNTGMSKNKPETSSEKSQTEENSKEKQIVNSSINSQSTSVKPILLNSYLIKSNLPNEPVDSSKNVADQSNTSKKPRPEMITNTREPSMNTGMSKNKPETSSEKYQTEENSKEKHIVNSSINSQSTSVKPILLNSYLIKSNLPNELVDSFKNAAGQSNTSKKPRPEMAANTTEPTMNPEMFKNKPETSSEKYQTEGNSKEPQNVNSSINSQSTTVKPILLHSYLIKSNLPNEPVDSSKNVADQSNTSKKPRPKMTANTTEPTMNPAMSKNKPETSSEKSQTEENSKEKQIVNSSINSQSTSVKPILLNSYLIKSNLPNEPVDSSKNVADQSNTSKNPRPEMITNTREPSMNTGMSKNKPETSSEKSQTEENSKEKQIVNSSINAQSTSVKPILLNSYLIKSNLPNEPVDSSKNVADQSNTSKKPRPKMTANTTEPTMNPAMSKNKPETSSEKYQTEENSKEKHIVNSSINSQSTSVKPILLNSYLIKSNLPNEPVDSSKNVADQSNTSKKPRPEMITNTREPSMNTGMSKNKPETSSEKYQTEENSKEKHIVNSSINSQSTSVKPILLNSYLIKSNLPNELVDSFKNAAGQSNTSKKPRPEMAANTTEPTMNPEMFKNKPETSSEKYQTEGNSKEPQNVNSSINSQSTTVKPILLHSYLIKSNLPNEPVDSSKNVADQSNTSKKPRPEMTANTTEPTMNPGMSKNKPETSSEKSQTEENSKEKQIVNSSINSQSTSDKPILLNSYLIKSNLPNEPVDSSKNVVDQSNTSKKPRPEMITNTREPSMNTGMSKNKPVTSSEKYQTEENSKEKHIVNSSINSQSTSVKPILLNSYLIKSNLPNELVDSFKNAAGQSNTSKKPRPEMTANTTEPTMNPEMFKNKPETSSEKYQREEKSKEAQNVNSSINSQSTTVKPILLNSYLKKSNLPNEPVDSSKNVADQSNTSKKPRPEMIANTREPSMDTGMSKNKPETSSEKYQTQENSKEPQNVISSINSQSTIVKPILLNSYLIKSNLPNEPLDSFKNAAGQLNTSKKPRPEMIANTREPSMDTGMSKNKPETSSENFQTEKNSKEPQDVNSSINSQSKTVTPIFLNTYFIKPIPSNELVDPSNNVAEPSKVSEEQEPATSSERYKSTTNFNNPLMTTSPQHLFDSESTELDALSLLIAKLVADFKNLRSLPDYEKSQHVVDTDNQQPVVRSSISPPVVDSEDSQPEFHSGIPQPVVTSSSSHTLIDSGISQPAVDPGSPQSVVDSGTQQTAVAPSMPQPVVDPGTPQSVVDPGTPQFIVNYGTQRIAVASSTSQPAVDSESPQSVVDSGTQQPAVASSNLQLPVDSGTPQSAVDSGTQQSVVDFGTPQPEVVSGTPQPALTSSIPHTVINSGISQPVVDPGTSQPRVVSGTQQPAVASSNAQPAVDSGTPQSVVDSGTQQTAVAPSMPQPVVDPRTPQPVVDSGTQQPAVVSSTPQFAVDSRTTQSVVDFGTQQPSVAFSISQPVVDSRTPQSLVDSGTPQPAVVSSIPQPIVDSEIPQLVIDPGTPQPIVDSGTQQPAVASSTPQPAVDSGTPQPIVDSGTQQPAVSSSIPQPAVDSGTPQSVVDSETQQPAVVSSIPQFAIDPGTPQSIVNSGTQQAAIASSTPEPAVDSGTPQSSAVDSGIQQPSVVSSIPQPVVDSGTQHPAVVSSIPQPILDSEIPQLVIDPGTPQPIAVAFSISQPAVDSGTPQSVDDSETQPPSVAASISQPVLDSGTQQPVVDSGTQQTAVASSTLQSVVDSGTQKPSVASSNPQALLDSGTQLSVVNSGTQQPAVAYSISQPVVDSGTPQSVVDFATQQPSVAFSIPQTVLDSGTSLSVVDSETQQPAVAYSISQPVVDSGTLQSVFDFGTQHPAVASSIPQPLGYSGTPQSVDDSGTQQPSVASSIPQPVVDSGTPQSVVVSETPQIVFNSKGPQQSPHTDKSQPGLGSKGSQKFPHSDKSQPGGSKRPQQIIHSDKSQLGADSKGPQQSDKSQSGVESKGPQQSPHSDKSEPGGSKESQKSPHSDKSKPGLGPKGSPQSTHSDKSERPGNSRESKPSPGIKKPAKPSSSGESIN
jgi:hypothetical protein